MGRVLLVLALVLAMWLVAAPAGGREPGLTETVDSGEAGFDPDPGRQPDEAAPPPADNEARASWYESLARSGSSTVEQARNRTQIQSQAKELSQLLAEGHPTTYAGLWIDIEAPFLVHVGFVGDGGAKAVKDAAATSGFSFLSRLNVHEADFSLARLLATYDSLAEHVPATHADTKDDLVAWVDVIANVVQARHRDAAIQPALEQAGPPGAVSFEVGTSVAENHLGIRGGQPTNNSCTTGFVVKKNSSIEAGITTAAHCSVPTGLHGVSSPVFGPQLSTWSGGSDPDIDAQWLGLADRDWWPANQIVWNQAGNTLTIRGRTPYSSINVGDYLCKYGISTHDSCGYVQSVACCYSGHRFVEVGPPMETMGGDSGGPVYELNEPYFYAVGAHKGGSFDGDPLIGAVSFFETDFGVSVATSSMTTPAYDWFLRNSNSQGNATAVWEWAESGSTPVAGRWMSNQGKDQPGFYKNGTWDLEGQARFTYGTSSDVPIVGDWDSDDLDEVGYFRPTTAGFYRRGTSSIAFGNPGDIPLVGDWDGDGDDEIGVFRPSQVKFYLRSSSGSVTSIYYGTWNDLPVVGDWDDDGVDEVGVFRPSTGQWFLQGLSGFYYGSPNDTPLPGDWDGDGRDTVGVTR